MVVRMRLLYASVHIYDETLWRYARVSSMEEDSGVSSSSNWHGVVKADRARLVEKILPYSTDINLYVPQGFRSRSDET